MKRWNKKELQKAIDKFRGIYWKRIQLKDKLLHWLFEDTIEKFGIAGFVYGYELGRRERKLKTRS